ncbi:MAG: hypothetical protein ACFFEN_07555 [Candidatus Thorarchaeota archaeon]
MEKNKDSAEIDKIILRNYPKVIFFTPLFLISIIFWVIQSFLTELNPWLGLLWIIIFFSNFTVAALDFPSYRVLIVILGVVIIVLLAIFLGLIPTLKQLGIVSQYLRIGLTAEFYMIMTIILGFILGLIVIIARFDYYRIEANEVIHKKGIFSTSAERFPVRGLRIKIEIPDLFEYFIFKAGRITLLFAKNQNKVLLNTVLNIKKKAEHIDFLLSSIHIIID